MLRALACLGLLTALLAVPTGSLIAAGQRGPDPASDVTEVRFYGCEAHFGFLGLNNVEANQAAPPGFTPQQWVVSSIIPLSASTVYAQECDRVETDTGHVFHAYAETMHLMRLSPPPEHSAPTIHNLPLRIMTNDAYLAEVYHRWGWTATPQVGEIGLATQWVDGQALQGTTLGTNAEWGMAIVVGGSHLGGTWDGARIRFYGTHGGTVTTVSEFDINPAPVWPGNAAAGRTAFSYTHGGATLQPSSAGPGQIFRWPDDDLTQTLTLL